MTSPIGSRDLCFHHEKEECDPAQLLVDDAWHLILSNCSIFDIPSFLTVSKRWHYKLNKNDIVWLVFKDIIFPKEHKLIKPFDYSTSIPINIKNYYCQPPFGNLTLHLMQEGSIELKGCLFSFPAIKWDLEWNKEWDYALWKYTLDDLEHEKIKSLKRLSEFFSFKTPVITLNYDGTYHPEPDLEEAGEEDEEGENELDYADMARALEGLPPNLAILHITETYQEEEEEEVPELEEGGLPECWIEHEEEGRLVLILPADSESYEKRICIQFDAQYVERPSSAQDLDNSLEAELKNKHSPILKDPSPFYLNVTIRTLMRKKGTSEVSVDDSKEDTSMSPGQNGAKFIEAILKKYGIMPANAEF